ncbi:MAG: transglutaminase family protein [Chlamydiota bacterium]|nr:transglutaminase family protein [Chlamydiota bacterium]
MVWRLFLFAFFSSPLMAILSEERVAYSQLAPCSLADALAFDRVHPTGAFHVKIADRVHQLVGHDVIGELPFLTQVVRRSFSDAQLAVVDRVSSHFPHRQLSGFRITSKEKLFELPSEAIDIASALALYESEDPWERRQIEAKIDLIALEVQGYLPKNPTPDQTIDAINRVLFFDHRYHFPPDSRALPEIAKYSSLRHVIDSQQGVCLGVTLLYFAIAQRLALPLLMVTPPGHIYLRLEKGMYPRNMETTARGIHLPDHRYASYIPQEHPIRTVKEAIGLLLMNRAGEFQYRGDYEQALSEYLEAMHYLCEDPLLHASLGYMFLLTGNMHEGKEALYRAIQLDGHRGIVRFLPQDLLLGKVSLGALRLLLSLEDKEKRKKRETLEMLCHQHPHSRALLFELISLLLEEGQEEEAVARLLQCHACDREDPMVLYLLCYLALQRLDYQQAWEWWVALRKHDISPESLKVLTDPLKAEVPHLMVKMDQLIAIT